MYITASQCNKCLFASKLLPVFTEHQVLHLLILLVVLKLLLVTCCFHYYFMTKTYNFMLFPLHPLTLSNHAAQVWHFMYNEGFLPSG